MHQAVKRSYIDWLLANIKNFLANVKKLIKTQVTQIVSDFKKNI